MIGGVIFALWCGALWRVRGGAWETLLRLPPSTIAARMVAAAGIAAPPLSGQPPMTIAALILALFLGMSLAGWGRAMDIGRVAGSRWLDTVAMSGWGIVTVLPAVVAVMALAITGVLPRPSWPLLVAGALFGPIYALAWHLPRLPNLRRFAAGPTEWAEVACGAAIGTALWAAL